MVCRQLSRVLIISYFVFMLLSQVWSRRGSCGKSSLPPTLVGLVTGGRKAQQGEWPWMAAIMKKNESGIDVPWCTGFLIDEEHVLSAAHCFNGSQPIFFSARIGHVNLTMADSYSVHRITIPDGYREGMFYNDIALLTLSRKVEIPGFYHVCLPPRNTLRHLTGKGTTVVGWGSTDSNGPMSTILNQLSGIPVLPNSVCEHAYGGSFGDVLPWGITDEMICAGFQNETGRDSCWGDSGGPLMIREINKWFAVGVVSYGYSCGRPDFPGVYTRISSHMPWITEQKREDKNEISTMSITPESETTVNPRIPTGEEKNEISTMSITPESETTVNPRIPTGICPSEHVCQDASQCSPRAMKLITGPPKSCGEREKICCPETSMQPVTTTPNPLDVNPVDGSIINPNIPLNVNPGNCGKSFGSPITEGLLHGVKDAEQGAWPWMVSIMIENKRGILNFYCSGFLIDRKHVVSAAQCFDLMEEPGPYATRIGNVNFTKGDVYSISKIAVHNRHKRGQYYNDIALVTLSKEVNISNFTPICLPSSKTAANLTGRNTTIVAWGATRRRSISPILKQLSAVAVVSNDVCERTYSEGLTYFRRQFPQGISPEMICAWNTEKDGRDICDGSSGGPMMMREDDRWYAIGVLSFSFRCGVKGYPGGYTKVSEYVDWINSNKS